MAGFSLLHNPSGVFRHGILLLAVLACSPLLRARDVDSPPPADGARSTEEPALTGEVNRQIELRYANIEYLQETAGIYHPSLGEAYSDLAFYLSEQERFEEAVSVYDQALSITRINSGLYSEDQFPIIQALIAGNNRLKNWQEVDDLHELSLHMSRRLFGIDDARYIHALADFGHWKIRLLRENLLDRGLYSLSDTADDLSETFEAALAALEAGGGGTPHQFLTLIYGKSEADVLLARAVAQTPFTAFEGGASRYITRRRCQQVRNAQGQIETRCVNVQVENPQYRASQRNAKNYALTRYARAIGNSIERLVSIRDQNPDLSPAEIEEIDAQIAMLQLQSDQILRAGRRGLLL